MIAFGHGASLSTRAFHPQAEICRKRYISITQPLLPPIGNLNILKYQKTRVAIPEPLLGRDFSKLLPKLLEELHITISYGDHSLAS